MLLTVSSLAQSRFGERKTIARESVSENETRRNPNEMRNPFDPGGGGTGDPIPINGGILLLVGLSVVYFARNRKDIHKQD